MVQWVACLLYKHEDLRLNPQHPQNVGVLTLVCNSSVGETNESQGPAGKAGSITQWLKVLPLWLKKRV